ncbi:MAG: hypothetical protein V5A88_02200 [Candidatus Thermoplasmatota archaeon]
MKVQREHDDRVRKLFYGLTLLLFVWIVYTVITQWDGDIFDLVTPLLNGLVTIFLVIGVFSMLFYRKRGLINTKDVLKVLLGLSFFLTLLTLVLGYSLYRPFLLPILREYIPGFGSFFMSVIIFFIFFFSYLIGFLFLLLQSFGLVNIIVLFQRKYFPKIFEDIRRTTGAREENEDLLSTAYQSSLTWIFDIPKALDTAEITIEKETFQDSFSWKSFRSAFFLESILAVVIAIYISLNPLLLAERSLTELFALASSVSYFIPVIVLPLFIYWRLGVKIPGPAADFYLFEGARSRLLGLILTLGTILLFLRLALRTFDPEILLYSFLFYFAGFLVNTFFITFVYFNYFENLLAKDLLYEFEEKS